MLLLNEQLGVFSGVRAKSTCCVGFTMESEITELATVAIYNGNGMRKGHLQILSKQLAHRGDKCLPRIL